MRDGAPYARESTSYLGTIREGAEGAINTVFFNLIEGTGHVTIV